LALKLDDLAGLDDVDIIASALLENGLSSELESSSNVETSEKLFKCVSD